MYHPDIVYLTISPSPLLPSSKYDSDAMKLITLQDEVRKLKETVDLEQKIIDDERAKRYKEGETRCMYKWTINIVEA